MRRRYQEVPQGGRTARVRPEGSHARQRPDPVPLRGVARREVRPDLRRGQALGRPPSRRAAREQGRGRPALARTVEVESVDRDHDLGRRARRGLGGRRRTRLVAREKQQDRDEQPRGRRGGEDAPKASGAGSLPACAKARARKPSRTAAARKRAATPIGTAQSSVRAESCRPRLCVPPIQSVKTEDRRHHARGGRGDARRPDPLGQPREDESEERGGHEVGRENVQDERGDRSRRSAENGVRGFDRRHGRQRRAERADEDGRQERAAPPLEDGPEEQAVDAGVEIAELPQPRAGLVERGPRPSRAAVPDDAREVRENGGAGAERLKRQKRRREELVDEPVRRFAPEHGGEVGAVGVAARRPCPSRFGSPSRSSRSSVIWKARPRLRA